MSQSSRKRPRTAAAKAEVGGWMDCTSLERVAIVSSTEKSSANAKEDANPTISQTPESIIVLETKLASVVTKEIFFDRFRKEIVQGLHFSLQSPKKKAQNGSTAVEKEASKDNEKASWVEKEQTILKECIRVGLKACSKALCLAEPSSSCCTKKPDLVVLSSDFKPPSMAVHIPILAHQLNIPLLLLPDASQELGTALRVRSVGALAFCLFPGGDDEEEAVSDEYRRIRSALESFVSFVKSSLL